MRRFSSEPSTDQATPAHGMRLKFAWPQKVRICRDKSPYFDLESTTSSQSTIWRH